jgi:hypothetical protein
MRNLFIAAVGAAALSTLVACSESPTAGMMDAPTVVLFSEPGDTDAGVTPQFNSGTVPGDTAEEVCYAALGLEVEGLLHAKADWDEDEGWVHEVDGEWVAFTNPHLTITTDGDPGSYLDFDANGGLVFAAILKGGPNYNLYDYTPEGIGSDGHLHSPEHPSAGQVPAISHFNFCYLPAGDPNGFEGCTIGYWQNHDGSQLPGGGPPRWRPDAWEATDFDTGTLLHDEFDIDAGYGIPGDDTFRMALDYQGGSELGDAARLLLRQAVAALLSASHPDVEYEWSVSEIRTAVDAALASGDRDTILELAATLDAMNNAGCPLSRD